MKIEELRLEDLLIKYPLDAVTPSKFGELLGKSANAIDMMVKNDKCPWVEMQDPTKPKARAEKYIYIPDWNEGMRKAFLKKPPELRHAWLAWLGL
ncbi:TPA: Cox family DNA-binding protein [Salmonella enterica subsp. enterica serovar Muenchen]